jgi:hypothetical protein
VSDKITIAALQEMAGHIERLLIEKQGGIDFAFNKIPDDLRINISIDVEHTIPPTVNYSVSYPLEPKPEPVTKDKITLKKVIGQGDMGL